MSMMLIHAFIVYHLSALNFLFSTMQSHHWPPTSTPILWHAEMSAAADSIQDCSCNQLSFEKKYSTE
jgi:hypothetical protein